MPLHVPKEQRSRAEWLEAVTHHYQPTDQLRAVLDGVLLSDGSIQRIGQRGTASLRVMQHPSRRGWLRQIQRSLRAACIQTSLDHVTKAPSMLEGRLMPEREYDLLRTLNYSEFVLERERWYPGGRKAVPRDLCLTPVALNHWFCGDGRGGDQKGTLGICTDGFSVEDVRFLIERLHQDLGIGATLQVNHRGHPQVMVGRRDEAVRLAQHLEHLIPACCRYKLQHVHPLQTEGRGRRLSEDVKLSVIKDRGSCTVRVAAERHGVSVSKVWSLWNSV